jgi:hypothetical protein
MESTSDFRTTKQHIMYERTHAERQIISLDGFERTGSLAVAEEPVFDKH